MTAILKEPSADYWRIWKKRISRKAWPASAGAFAQI